MNIRIICTLALLWASLCSAFAAMPKEVEVGYLEELTWVKGKPLFFHQDQFVIVVDHNHGQSNKFYVVDIRDITHPKVSDIVSISASSKGRIHEYKLNHAADKLFVTSADSLLIYDVSNPESINLLSKTAIVRATSFAITFDDKYLYLSGCYKNEFCDGLILFEINGETLNFVKEFEIATESNSTSFPSDITISPDGKKLAYGSILDHPLVLADISDKAHVVRLDDTTKPFYNRGSWKTSAKFREGRFSADSRYLYIASGQSGLLVFDTKDNELDKVQQTSGRHWQAIANNTGAIYSFDLFQDTIYLAGKSDEIKSEIGSVKGFNNAYFWQGSSLSISTDGTIITFVDKYTERCVKFIKIIQEK